ncbi:MULTISPECIES: alpha/beta hydrolase fold domain-containing protein [unclassified Rhodococcus (in: high G+C Gram-positive bacteria)]|uniref:alpha/beta hydrolase fold domain-containing protein n=1 Tax=unclassified Rhodococcus (in: high G+C Gram-positive bacteria) TaxID=192944 RepID=UPI00163A7555|nr:MULTISPECIES: alpha/beta hydrolase fold domain-containing protein [unclassified Rhodococcus (in: high G+C Gram-positive bacteria)]MBC2637663.1 alpha/beta hydrolase fold domain-containing protein [Rhodococcus sp. 3A]MBC2897593.1 alpha/beta hydrolase fold domain-containing protein [Rhodococcus sp. 4CII]
MLGTDSREAALHRARESFASVFASGRPTLKQLRSNLDAMMLEPALADDVSVEELTVAGVDCLRVTAGPEIDGNVLVWFHGGGYVMGSAHGYRHAAAALARALGSAVLLPEYRLAPEAPFPAAVEDAAAVLGAVVAEHGPEHTAVGGDSAGGGLTIAALVRTREAGSALPATAVVVSPLADFTAAGASVTANAGTDPVITERALGLLAASYLQGHDPRDPLASPVFADLAGLPPLLLLASDSETLLDDSVRIHESVQAAGGTSTLSVYPDTCHAWTLFSEFLPQAREGVDEIARALREVLR